MLTREQSNKIPREYENPIDNIIIDTSYFLGDSFKRNNYTPNMITTLSTITAIICIYTYVKHKYIISAIFLFLSYFFDCLDGNFARRYNMETEFGDYYDHIKDMLFYTILMVVIFYRLRKNKYFLLYLTIYIILTVLGTIFHGCTNIYIRNKKSKFLNSKTLGTTEKWCYDKPGKLIKKMKYFSMGTAVIYTIFLILISKYQ